MRNIKKRFTITFVIVLTLFAMTDNIAAAQIEISPLYVNTSSISVSLGFGDENILACREAFCTGTVVGLSGVNYIEGTLVLERLNSNGTYTRVKTWTSSANAQTFYLGESCAVNCDYTYRLTFTVVCYKNGVPEQVSISKSSYCTY